MIQYRITSTILNAYDAQIHFGYYVPEHNAHWQDKYHGSIDILDIAVPGCVLLFDELPIMERIHIRRACWNYLEANGLFQVSKVLPLSLYPLSFKKISGI